MRKPAFCMCENKGSVTAKLISAFVFATQIVQSPYLRNSKLLAIFCGCTAWFVSDLVENPEDQFSHNEAQILMDHFLQFSINFEMWPVKTEQFGTNSPQWVDTRPHGK